MAASPFDEDVATPQNTDTYSDAPAFSPANSDYAATPATADGSYADGGDFTPYAATPQNTMDIDDATMNYGHDDQSHNHNQSGDHDGNVDQDQAMMDEDDDLEQEQIQEPEQQQQQVARGGGNGNNNKDPDQVAKESRITTPYLTKYEKARILGTRALQISMGAPVMVEMVGETDPLEIAQKELRERKIPMIIRRFLPDGTYEDWKVSELKIR
eukprot:CAMPEP_0201566632 /NCGR_PEP_ID=MMETSP0190_2-20130828/6565_1 /ASSEMBLY_ACC=CAM_ASM_000263 /TAXON_ID=37353 /ORGANISM="Rosalina sp." /LENGTH=212 /DNA_ID=CAMNT_0047985623 /DNA_START=27 /DNA_END=665 /DNA_ORIENTATION=+